MQGPHTEELKTSEPSEALGSDNWQPGLYLAFGQPSVLNGNVIRQLSYM